MHSVELKKSIERMKSRMIINFSVYGSNINNEDILLWFHKLCFFKPTRMGFLDKHRQYNANIFEQAILESKDGYGSFELEDRSGNYMWVMRNSTSNFRLWLPIEIWNREKNWIVRFLDDFFTGVAGCFGYAVNDFDNRIIQNPTTIDSYEFYGVTDSDFPGIRDIPIVLNEISPNLPPRIDPAYLPGSKVLYDHMTFLVAPYMWIGPDFYYLVPQQSIQMFDNCEEKTEFAPGFYRICLWQDMYEYNMPPYRNRQWEFRKKMNLDVSWKNFKEKFPPSKKGEKEKYARVEIFKTKNEQSSLLIRFYVDPYGCSCAKVDACSYIEREMKGNTIIRQDKINFNEE